MKAATQYSEAQEKLCKHFLGRWISLDHGLRTPDKGFLKQYPKILRRLRQIGRKSYEVFGVFLLLLSSQILSLSIPSP